MSLLRPEEDATLLAKQARQYRRFARMFRNGTTVHGLTLRRCERNARTLEAIVRDIADSYIADAMLKARQS